MVCAVSGLSAEMDRADVPHSSGQLPKDNKDFEWQTTPQLANKLNEKRQHILNCLADFMTGTSFSYLSSYST